MVEGADIHSFAMRTYRKRLRWRTAQRVLAWGLVLPALLLSVYILFALFPISVFLVVVLLGPLAAASWVLDRQVCGLNMICIASGVCPVCGEPGAVSVEGQDDTERYVFPNCGHRLTIRGVPLRAGTPGESVPILGPADTDAGDKEN